jgi:hypothetical protein
VRAYFIVSLIIFIALTLLGFWFGQF